MSKTSFDFINQQKQKIQTPEAQKILGKEMVEKISASIDRAQESGDAVDLGELLDTQIMIEGALTPQSIEYFRDQGILQGASIPENLISQSSRAGVIALLEKHDVEPTSDRVLYLAAGLDANTAIEIDRYLPNKPEQETAPKSGSENTTNVIEMGSKP